MGIYAGEMVKTLYTEVCDILEIKYPILQGGMAWVSDEYLVGAVSEAGCLGIIASGTAPGDWVETRIIETEKRTKKSFGVNVMLLSPFVDDIVDAILRHDSVKVVTTGAGNPAKYIERFKSKGIKVIPVVASVAFAKRMEEIGADAVIAEGNESGGHVGQLNSMPLVPQIVDAVSIPVIAAGGIADGRGFVAAMALGAKGIQMGTRFIASVECNISMKYKEKIISANDRSTVVTGRITGHPVRVAKNRLAREFMRLEAEGANKEQLEEFGKGKLRLAAKDGDVRNGSVMMGQCAGIVNDVKPVKDIISDIIEQAEIIIKRLYIHET